MSEPRDPRSVTLAHVMSRLGGTDAMQVAVLREDLAAAREAIRILLGDAGLDGLGDLTTVDGRSVVDIVRRGMGVAR